MQIQITILVQIYQFKIFFDHFSIFIFILCHILKRAFVSLRNCDVSSIAYHNIAKNMLACWLGEKTGKHFFGLFPLVFTRLPCLLGFSEWIQLVGQLTCLPVCQQAHLNVKLHIYIFLNINYSIAIIQRFYDIGCICRLTIRDASSIVFG